MGDSPIRGAALLRLWRDQQGLELVSLQGRLGGGGDQGEVGHQGGGLVQGIVLAEGDKVDVFPGQQRPDGGGGGGQPVVGGGGDEQGRPLRRWALAAMVTLESVTPAASLPRVLPVQGQRMSRSSSF